MSDGRGVDQQTDGDQEATCAEEIAECGAKHVAQPSCGWLSVACCGCSAMPGDEVIDSAFARLLNAVLPQCLLIALHTR